MLVNKCHMVPTCRPLEYSGSRPSVVLPFCCDFHLSQKGNGFKGVAGHWRLPVKSRPLPALPSSGAGGGDHCLLPNECPSE